MAKVLFVRGGSYKDRRYDPGSVVDESEIPPEALEVWRANGAVRDVVDSTPPADAQSAETQG